MQSPVLKYTLLLVGATLGAFVVALLGAYMVLPSIAPDAVGTAADSLATSGADTTEQASAPEASAPGASEQVDMAGDTTATPPSPDSAAGSRPIVQRLRDSLTVVGQLQDSLQTLRKQLRATKKNASALRKQVSSLEGRDVKVGELKNALLGMGQRELTTVLAGVDMRVLEELYQRTSGRSRTQLLRAMSADRTARFVNQVIGGQGDDARGDTTNADSTRADGGEAEASPFR